MLVAQVLCERHLSPPEKACVRPRIAAPAVCVCVCVHVCVFHNLLSDPIRQAYLDNNDDGNFAVLTLSIKCLLGANTIRLGQSASRRS